MKDIKPKLIGLFREGYCTPQIARVAKKIKEPSTTIHYNIKKLESEGAIKAYKAVFDYKKIEQGFTAFVLIQLDRSQYGNPEKIGEEIASYPQVESVDLITGDWEIIIKVRTKDQDEYYEFIKQVFSKDGIAKSTSLTSLNQLKCEFVRM